jgi:hypothetical protein
MPAFLDAKMQRTAKDAKGLKNMCFASFASFASKMTHADAQRAHLRKTTVQIHER